jgi:hypothetical protein
MLTNKIANKLFNSDYIKDIYPMIDRIETHVISDDDDEFPLYTLFIVVHLNDSSINNNNMYEKGFDPHYLVQTYLKFMLKMAGISTRDIIQISVLVRNPNGEIVYG